MRELINKKFKTEKATKKRMEEKWDEKLYFDEKRAERHHQAKMRKEMEE